MKAISQVPFLRPCSSKRAWVKGMRSRATGSMVKPLPCSVSKASHCLTMADSKGANFRSALGSFFPTRPPRFPEAVWHLCQREFFSDLFRIRTQLGGALFTVKDLAVQADRAACGVKFHS